VTAGRADHLEHGVYLDEVMREDREAAALRVFGARKVVRVQRAEELGEVLFGDLEGGALGPRVALAVAPGFRSASGPPPCSRCGAVY